MKLHPHEHRKTGIGDPIRHPAPLVCAPPDRKTDDINTCSLAKKAVLPFCFQRRQLAESGLQPLRSDGCLSVDKIPKLDRFAAMVLIAERVARRTRHSSDDMLLVTNQVKGLNDGVRRAQLW